MTPAQSASSCMPAIRRDARAGMTEREIQRTHHVGWRTVKAALDSAVVGVDQGRHACHDLLQGGGRRRAVRGSCVPAVGNGKSDVRHL